MAEMRGKRPIGKRRWKDYVMNDLKEQLLRSSVKYNVYNVYNDNKFIYSKITLRSKFR